MRCDQSESAGRALARCCLLMAAVLAAPPVLAGTIKIDGSSTVYPITDAVAAEFKKSGKGAVTVTVGISGTGGGFRKFCRGETDISNASRPILTKEMEECRAAGVEFLELPVAFDALTVVVNQKNSFLTSITVGELKRLWEPAAQGKVLHWDQVNSAWPHAPVKLFGPGADSGTFDYFTEAVVGVAKASRLDYAASEDDTVLVRGVSRDINALGYFGYSYYAANRQKLKALPIAGQPGKPAVEPSLEAVVRGTYQPLSRPIFIYVNAKSMGRSEVRDFVQFYIRNGARFAAAANCVPLPESAYDAALKHVQVMKKGTVFSGVPEIGITIEELLKRESRP
jgi:phosphate transport system substrate-binding protein